MSKFTIHPAARIGHVNMKVADIGRALAFYCDVLGFRIRRYRPGTGAYARSTPMGNSRGFLVAVVQRDTM